MRITFLLATANLSGGVRVVAEHARILHERGHTVTVVSVPRKPVTRLDQARDLVRGRKPRARTRPGQHGPSHLDGSPADWRVIGSRRAIEAADVPDADLIVATWWRTAEWAEAMPASKGVKVNFLQGYEAHPGQPKDRVDAVWRLPMRKIVVSGWLDEIARGFGDDSAILIPNGLDTGAFPFVERGPSGRGVIGTMYTAAPFKRFGLAAAAVRELQRRGVACELVGFGTRPPKEGTDLPPGTALDVLPSQRRIAEIYASCDCWLFTSEREGYGLPLLEAMSCGTPVVATPAGAARELMAAGGGTLVDSDNPALIADAVERVLGLGEAGWRGASRAARAEAERHSWEVVGTQMEAALRRILDEERAG